MPRPIWSGTVSFGLVNVPVKLFSATEQKDISFHQFERGTGERIRYKRVAEGTGKEVEYKDIVKGYELDKGKYVIIEPEELEAVEPGASRTVEIEDFIDLDDIDPIYFERTYYLAPASNAEKAYALLRDAMEDANKVAVGRLVMRTKQYLAAIRPSGDLLVLNTMYFPDEVREPKSVDNYPESVEASARERDMAKALIESLSTDWQPEKYRDTFRERVLDLIDRKAEGENIVIEKSTAEPTKVVDLMAALQASLDAVKNDAGADDAKQDAPKKGRKKKAS